MVDLLDSSGMACRVYAPFATPARPLTTNPRSPSIETVSRDISLAAHAQAESLESMSGSITLRRDSHVTGDVETGSGALVLEPGSEVAGDQGLITRSSAS
jgi:hypothetical protein